MNSLNALLCPLFWNKSEVTELARCLRALLSILYLRPIRLITWGSFCVIKLLTIIKGCRKTPCLSIWRSHFIWIDYDNSQPSQSIVTIQLIDTVYSLLFYNYHWNASARTWNPKILAWNMHRLCVLFWSFHTFLPDGMIIHSALQIFQKVFILFSKWKACILLSCS